MGVRRGKELGAHREAHRGGLRVLVSFWSLDCLYFFGCSCWELADFVYKGPDDNSRSLRFPGRMVYVVALQRPHSSMSAATSVSGF